ncbi:MAG TPA: DUF3857 domain-containing protein [Burkholderiaceae bacterium]|nr:DUF3857 domain-containing protein [Burkholderiaceae bacterium]
MSLSAFAQSGRFTIERPPSWVVEVQAPPAQSADPTGISGGVYAILVDRQVRAVGKERMSYQRRIYKALNEQGVGTIANIDVDFNPSHQTLILHGIWVIREGQRSARLKASDVKILQRERDLEAQVYDGTVTASVFLDDVRVGDLVEFAWTVRGHNPVFGQRHHGRLDMQWSVPIGRLHTRLIGPERPALVVKAKNGVPAAQERPGAPGEKVYVWLEDNVPALTIDSGAPAWYDPYRHVDWGSYAQWSDVVQWALPLYTPAAEPGPKVRGLIARLAADHADADSRLVEALRTVQRDVRYLAISVGQGSHAPRDPEDVLRRRFGDCKDKSLLLVALLRGLGIEAHAAFVNTDIGRGVANWLPSPGAFNHVVVRARLNDRTFWLDPTNRTQLGTVDSLTQADHGLALVVTPATSELESMHGHQRAGDIRRIHAVLDLRAGLAGEALYTVTTTSTKEAADSVRWSFQTQRIDELQRNYLNFYASYFKGIEPVAPPQLIDDPQANQVQVIERYRIPAFWETGESEAKKIAEILVPDMLSVLQSPKTKVRNAPLALRYPLRIEQRTEVLMHAPWDKTVFPDRITDPAFELERTMRWDEPKRLVIEDRFESRAEQLEARDMARYVEALERARKALGFQFTHTDSTLAASEGEMHASGWLAVALGLLTGALACFLLNRWDPPARPLASSELYGAPEGLKGWMILPIAILALQLIISLGAVFMSAERLTQAAWAQQLETAGLSGAWAWGIKYWVNIVIALWSLLAQGLALKLIFERRTSSPWICIGLGIGGLIWTGLDTYWIKLFSEASTATQRTAEVLGSILWTGVWTAYFIRSRRVRRTFTRYSAALRHGTDPAQPEEPDSLADAAAAGAAGLTATRIASNSSA